MTASKYGVSLGSDENILKLDSSVGCTTVNILITTELYTLKGGIVWYVNYISRKLLFLENELYPVFPE